MTGTPEPPDPRKRRSLAEFEAYIATALDPPFDAGPPPRTPSRPPPVKPPAASVLDRVTDPRHGRPPTYLRKSDLWDEDGLVLRDLDRLDGDLTAPPPANEAGGTTPGTPDAARDPIPAGRSTGDGWGVPTLYLEERLRLAHSAVSNLGSEMQQLDEHWRDVRDTISSLRLEIDRAHREMQFVRSVGWEAAGAGSASSSAPPPPGAGQGTAGTAAAAGPPGGGGYVSRVPAGEPPGAHPYRQFTADRYNQTIADLQARRRKLVIWTLVSAALISAGLVAVTALFREPTPPLWLAVLPAVWMIPVPFFVLSFRGTQRVLRRNHLSLEGEA